MHLTIIILVAVVLGFALGAIAFDKLHTQVAEKYAADKAALTDEYNNLLARAHAERDRLFALIHPSRSVTVTGSVGGAGSKASAPAASTADGDVPPQASSAALAQAGLAQQPPTT